MSKHEILDPSLTDQRTAFTNQFQGMSQLPLYYDDFEQTRMRLIDAVTSSLSSQGKECMLRFHDLESNWAS